MANLLSYAKNVGRSVVYTSIDVIESSNPTLKAFAEANQDLGKEAFAAIKDYKGTVQKARTSIKQNQYYKLIATAKKNIFEDLKSGNWYNKERENAVYDELTSYDDSDDWSFGDDIDFGDNDNSDEIELEVNESEVTRKTINTVGQAAANAVAKATVHSADYMATISIENTKMLMEDNKKHFAQVNLGLGAINSNISSIVRLGEPLTVHMQNSQKYYERTTTLLEENNKLLQQLVDLNTPSTSRNNKDNDQRKDFGYIAGYEGMIDIRKYGELVKRNIKNKSSILDSMINIDTGSGNFSDSLVASPISELMKLGLEGVTKKYVGDVMDNFNKSLEGVFGSLLMNMNTNSNKKGGIYKLINDIFGIPMSHGGDLNTANYEKGKVDFDGIARKSIVEVIPTYLAKILASVSGEPEIRYNYDTGRFITVHELKKQKDAYDRRFRDSATSQFRSQANQITSKMVMSKRDKDQFDKDLDKFLQYLYNNGENFQYNNHNISGYDVGGIDDNSLAIIRAIYRINEATGKGWVNTQMNKNILYQKSREYQQREYDQKKGDNANLNLLNGSIDYSLDPEGKKDTSVQHYKDMKAKLFTDEEGRDIFFYLKDYYEQIGAINSNIQFIANNGISDNINGLSSNIKIHSKSEKKNNKLAKFKNKKFTKGKNKKEPPIFPLPVIYNEETGEYEVNHDFQSLYYDEETGQYVNGYNKIDWSLYEENEDGIIVPKTKKKYKINKNNKLFSKNNSGRNINNSAGNNYSNNTVNGVVNKRELPYFESEEKRRERERKEYDEQYHDSKMEKLEEQFWHMNMYGPEKGYDPEDLEERVFEFARFQNQVETSLKDSKKKKTIFEKLRDRKERSEGGAKLLEAADALAKGPVEFTTSILNTVNSTIYDMIFNEGDNEDEDGFLVTMKKRFNKTFDNFDETLDKLIDKMEGMWESGKDKINKFMKETLHLGFDLTDIKQGIFGEVDEETGIRSGGYLGDFIQNTKSSMGEIFDKITGVGNAAYGGKVKKTGVIAVSGGEYIIPAPGDKKEQLRKENEAKRRFFRSHGKSGWADLGNYADGGHVDGNINPDGTAEVEQATENDSKKRIEESKKKISESVSKQYVKAREAIKGHIDDTNTANAVDSIMEESGKNLPTLAAGGLLGAGFSLLTGLIGGPLLGAAVGAGGSLIMKSDKVKDILFGEIDEETGKRKKGMLPPGVTKFLTEKLPDMAKFGLGGGLASMVLPGGPIMGIMLGSAIGYAKNNEDFKNAIFGEGAIAEGLDTKLKKVLPKMGAGAALSALFSPLPGGIVSKLVLGAAVGFVSDSDKFKDLMFGTPTGKTDKNGKPIREGGIYGNLKKSFVDPLADFAKSYIHDSKIFFQENVFQPIKDLMDPIKNRAKRMKERAGNWIKKRAQKQMEKLKGSAGRIVGRRVVKVGAKISAAAAAKLAKLGITVEGGIIKTGINAVMAPIKGVGRRMRNKDTKQGYNDYEDIDDQIERLNGMHGDQSNRIQALEYMKNLTNQQRIALGDQVEYLGSMHTTQDSYLNAAAKKHRRKIAGAADNMHIKIGDENAIRKILGDKKTFANEQNENRARRKIESILKKYDMTLDDAEGTFGNIVKTAFDDLGNKTRNIANTNKEETSFDDLLSKTFGIDSNKLSDKDKEYFRHMLISQSKYAKANPKDEEEPAQVTIQDGGLVGNRTSSLKDPLPTKVDIDHILESLNTIVAAVTIMTNKATGNEFDPNKYATTDISKAINEAKQKNQQFRESGTEQTEEEYNDVFDQYYDDENYEDNKIENYANGGPVKRPGLISVTEGERVISKKKGPSILKQIRDMLSHKFSEDDYITTSKGGIIRLHHDRSGEKVPDMRDKQTIDALKDIEEDSNTQKGILGALNGEDGILSKLNLFNNKDDEDGKKKKTIFDMFKEAGEKVSEFKDKIMNFLSGDGLKQLKGKFKIFGTILDGIIGIGSPLLLLLSGTGALDGVMDALSDKIPGLKGNDTTSTISDNTSMTVDGKELVLDDDGNPIESDDGGYLTMDGTSTTSKNVNIYGTDNSWSNQVRKNIVKKAAMGQKSVLNLTGNIMKRRSSGRNILSRMTNIKDSIKYNPKLKSNINNIKNWAKDPTKYRSNKAYAKQLDTFMGGGIIDQPKTKIGKFLDTALNAFKNAIKKVGSKLPGIKKIAPYVDEIVKVIRTHMDDAIKTMAKRSPKALKNMADAIPIVNAVVFVADITMGIINSWGNAESILGIVDEATIGQKIVASLIGGINEAIPFIGGLIPNKTLVNIFMSIPPIKDLLSGFEEQRQKAKETVEAYNNERGTDYSIEEYNEMNGKVGVYTGLWNDTKSFIRNAKNNGIKDAAYNFYESQTNKGDNAIAPITILNKILALKKKKSMDDAEQDSNVASSDSNSIKDKDKKHPIRNFLRNSKEKVLDFGESIGDAVDDFGKRLSTFNKFLDNEKKKGKELFSNKDTDLKDLFTVDIPKDVPMGGILKAIAITSRLSGVGGLLMNKIGGSIGEKIDEFIQPVKDKWNFLTTGISTLNTMAKNGQLTEIIESKIVETSQGNSPLSWVAKGTIAISKLIFAAIAGFKSAGKVIGEKVDSFIQPIKDDFNVLSTTSELIKEKANAGDINGMFDVQVQDNPDNPAGFIMKGIVIADKIIKTPGAMLKYTGSKISDFMDGITSIAKSNHEAMKSGINELKEKAQTGDVSGVWNSKLETANGDPLSGIWKAGFGISRLFQTAVAMFHFIAEPVSDALDKAANWLSDLKERIPAWFNEKREAGKEWSAKNRKGVFDYLGDKYDTLRDWVGSGSRLPITGYRGGSSIMTPLSQRNQVSNVGSAIKSPVSMPGVNGGPNNFVSQVNPVLKNLPFTQNTTIEENGCAPAVATMAINEFRPKFMSMNKATQYASEGNYATDDGTDASYFKDILGNSGINTEYIENDDNKNSKAIRDTLMNQGNMILLGQDNRNKSKTNSPFGTGQHYVLARGFDKSGRVIVKDPESNKERTYDSDILNHVQLGIATHDRLGSGSNLKKKKKPSLFGYRGGSRDNSGNVQDTEYAQRTWSYLTSNGYTPEVAAAIMGNMEQESYVNPETHQNGGPAAGIVQWQHGRLDGLKSYAASKNFTWTQLEPQLDYMDAEITGNTDKIGAAVDTTAVGYFKDAYGSPELYKQGTDVDKATYEFMKYFERCHEEDANMEGRYKWAGQYYEMYSGSPYTATYSSENPGGATALDKMTQTNNAGRSLGTLATAAAGGIGGVVGSLAGMIGKALASMYGIKNMSLVDSLFGTSFGGGMMSGESSGGVYGSSGYSSSGVTSTGGQATVQGDGSGIVAAARSKIGQLQYSQSRRNEIFSGGPGADCSSFVQWAVKQGAGVDPGSNSDAIYNAQNGTDVSVGAFNESELMPGDVMLWRRSGGNTDGVGHADIYAGDHKKINNGGPNEGDIGAVEKTIGDTSTFLKAKRFFVPGQVIEGKLGNVTNPITGSLGYNTTDGYTQNMNAREQSAHPTYNTTDGYTQNSNARVSNTIKGDIGHVTTDGYTQNMNANANKANGVSQATQALTNIANSVSDINQTNVPSQNAQNPMNNGVNGKKGSGSKRSKLYLGGGSGLSTSSSLERPITRRAIRTSTPQHSASGSGLLKSSSSNKPKSSSKSYATSSTDRSVLETLQHKSKNNISSVVDVLVDILKEIKEVKTNTDNNQKILDLLTEFFKKQMESKFDNATAVDNDSIAELMANLAMMASS